MPKVLKVIEVVSDSKENYEDAIEKGVKETSKSVRNVRSVKVDEFSASVKNGKIDRYQVRLKIAFEIE
ncbi:MAG: dodecin family protein [Bacteroidota bacterium]